MLETMDLFANCTSIVGQTTRILHFKPQSKFIITWSTRRTVQAASAAYLRAKSLYTVYVNKSWMSTQNRYKLYVQSAAPFESSVRSLPEEQTMTLKTYLLKLRFHTQAYHEKLEEKMENDSNKKIVKHLTWWHRGPRCSRLKRPCMSPPPGQCPLLNFQMNVHYIMKIWFALHQGQHSLLVFWAPSQNFRQTLQ